MKKNTSERLQTLDASSVGILDTREPQQKSITSDEVGLEVNHLSSPCALSIIEEIQVFTDLGVKDLNGIIKSLKKPCYKLPKKYLRVEGNGNKLTRFAIRNPFLKF